MIAYFDTSAIAKLYFEEPNSNKVRLLYNQVNKIVTSAIAGPELASAINRRMREGYLTVEEVEMVWNDWLLRSRQFTEIPFTSGNDNIARQVFKICHKHSLRSADAIHVVSALTAAQVLFPGEMCTVITFDDDLKKAAYAEGLHCTKM